MSFLCEEYIIFLFERRPCVIPACSVMETVKSLSYFFGFGEENEEEEW
jgi:hypothetical protein